MFRNCLLSVTATLIVASLAHGQDYARFTFERRTVKLPDKPSGKTVAYGNRKLTESATFWNDPVLTPDGKTGYGITLNGKDSYLWVGKPQPSYQLEAYSVAMWIKTDYWQPNAANPKFLFDINDPKAPKFRPSLVRLLISKRDGIRFLAGGIEAKAEIDVFTNKWMHIASVWDGKHRRIYVDGRLKAEKSGDRNLAIVKPDHRITIGVQSHGGFHSPKPHRYPRVFKGTLDDIVVTSKALSETAIARLFAEGR